MGKELEGLLSRMAWESATILARSADNSEHSWGIEWRELSEEGRVENKGRHGTGCSTNTSVTR